MSPWDGPTNIEYYDSKEQYFEAQTLLSKSVTPMGLIGSTIVDFVYSVTKRNQFQSMWIFWRWKMYFFITERDNYIQ